MLCTLGCWGVAICPKLGAFFLSPSLLLPGPLFGAMESVRGRVQQDILRRPPFLFYYFPSQDGKTITGLDKSSTLSIMIAATGRKFGEEQMGSYNHLPGHLLASPDWRFQWPVIAEITCPFILPRHPLWLPFPCLGLSSICLTNLFFCLAANLGQENIWYIPEGFSPLRKVNWFFLKKIHKSAVKWKMSF